MWSNRGLPSPAVAEEAEEHVERPSCSPVTQHSREQPAGLSQRVRTRSEHRPSLAGATIMMDRSFYLWKDAAVCLQTPQWDLDSDLHKHLRYDLETQSLTCESVSRGRV